MIISNRFVVDGHFQKVIVSPIISVITIKQKKNIYLLFYYNLFIKITKQELL